MYILRSKSGKTPEMFSIKRVRFVILTRSKGNIDHSNSALVATDKIHVYILRSKCGKTPELFIDHSNSALAATDKIHVYILRSKCGKTPELFSIKGVRFVTNSKGINIDRSKSALAATDKMCIFFVLNVEKHQKCFL